MDVIAVVIAVLIGYVFGSVSFSTLLVRKKMGIDIRTHGSGNAGATNTLRVGGWRVAMLVLVLDIAKGVVPVLFAPVVVSMVDGGAVVDVAVLCAGLGAVLGHNWPIFFGFRGGKGVATTIGVFLAVLPLSSVLAGCVAIGVLVAVRIVSLASMTFALCVPIAAVLMGEPRYTVVWASLLGALLLARHRSNIIKLWRGTEHRFGARRHRGGQ
jgi:glycerol-3-phosphate acyltransferase PlsY